MTNIIPFTARTNPSDQDARLSFFEALDDADILLLDQDLPSFRDHGRLLFQILGPCATSVYTYEIEVLDYDMDSSAYWINEGEGFEYFLDQILPEKMEPGFYVLEGINGHYHRGDGWTTDDDVDWYHDDVRPATETEIADEALSLSPGRFKDEYRRELTAMLCGLQFEGPSEEMRQTIDEAMSLFGEDETKRLREEAEREAVRSLGERVRLVQSLMGMQS